MSEAAEIAEPVLDAASEAILDGVDEIVATIEVVKSNPLVLAAVGVAGLAVGLGGGYLAAKRVLSKHYEAIAEQEIAEAKEFYAGLHKVGLDGTAITPQDVLVERHGSEAMEALRGYRGQGEEPAESEDLETALDEQDEAQIRRLEEKARQAHEEYQANASAPVVEVTEEVTTLNVFTDPTFDLNEELKYRTEDKPYIITHDEYFAAERDYDTSTLTYFEDDDTVVDEQDKPLEDVDAIIGEDHLVRFGSGSKDRNIVYIRNDRLETDYEVVKAKGSYLEAVLGMGDDDTNSLRHSADMRRAFRSGADE